MSRGPGRIQRQIIGAFEAAPDQRLTTSEIAVAVYGDELEKWQVDAVSRSLRTLAPRLGLTKCRVGTPDRFGWRHIWGRAA